MNTALPDGGSRPGWFVARELGRGEPGSDPALSPRRNLGERVRRPVSRTGQGHACGRPDRDQGDPCPQARSPLRQSRRVRLGHGDQGDRDDHRERERRQAGARRLDRSGRSPARVVLLHVPKDDLACESRRRLESGRAASIRVRGQAAGRRSLPQPSVLAGAVRVRCRRPTLPLDGVLRGGRGEAARLPERSAPLSWKAFARSRTVAPCWLTFRRDARDGRIPAR